MRLGKRFEASLVYFSMIKPDCFSAWRQKQIIIWNDAQPSY